MRTLLLLPPIVALCISGIWLGWQHQTASALEQQCNVLEKTIAAIPSSAIAETTSRQTKSAAKASKGKEPLDWKKIAAQIIEMENSDTIGNMRDRMKLEQRLLALNKEELIAALDEIAALDLPNDARSPLEQILIGSLIEKDPQLALTKFIDRISDKDGWMSHLLSDALLLWAKKDSASAIAWFDQQIAAGKFDAKSLDGDCVARYQFEASLMSHLLSSAPVVAGHRLSVFPEDQRKEVIQYSSSQIKEEDQAAFAKLVREQLPVKDQVDAFSKISIIISQNRGLADYPKVSEFLKRIQATPAERTACVEQTAAIQILTTSFNKKITREDFDVMRKWVSAEASASMGKITGEALGSVVRNDREMNFTEAAELAVEYNTAAGNDDVLYSFLKHSDLSASKDEARILAEKISDFQRRSEILEKIK